MIIGDVNLNLRKVLLAFKPLHRCRLFILILQLDHLKNSSRAISPVLVVSLRHLELVEGRLDVDSVTDGHVLDYRIPSPPLLLRQDMLCGFLNLGRLPSNR